MYKGCWTGLKDKNGALINEGRKVKGFGHVFTVKWGVMVIEKVAPNGTINEVVNGFYRNGELINKNCRLGIISSGTGQGFAQSLGIPKNLDEQIITSAP